MWHDANFNKIADAGEPLLQGWTVGLYLNGVLVQAVLTDVNGVYRFSSVPPTDGTANRYELRFRAPGAGPNTAMLGSGDSPFTNGLQRITDIVVPSGGNLQNLNLPIDPNGVVYNSMTRAPVAGATLTLLARHARPCRRAASTIRPSRARSRSRTAITSSTSTSATRPARAAVTTSSW